MCEPSKNGSSSFRETADPSPKDLRLFFSWQRSFYHDARKGSNSFRLLPLKTQSPHGIECVCSEEV